MLCCGTLEAERCYAVGRWRNLTEGVADGARTQGHAGWEPGQDERAGAGEREGGGGERRVVVEGGRQRRQASCWSASTLPLLSLSLSLCARDD
eukprot:614025-Rhodomonas_salina.4